MMTEKNGCVDPAALALGATRKKRLDNKKIIHEVVTMIMIAEAGMVMNDKSNMVCALYGNGTGIVNG